MKVRIDLSPEQVEAIRECALDAFEDDAAHDQRYAREIVAHLAENRNMEWWLEFLSSDPGVYEDILGFNPLAD